MMRWVAFLMMLGLAGGGCARENANPSGPASARGQKAETQPAGQVQQAVRGAHAVAQVQVIPWVELNSVTRQGVDDVVAGLIAWQSVTDRAIVTTVAGRAGLYTELRRRVPGMTIIPGLKTAGICDPFDDVAGWRRIASEVAAMTAAAGVPIAVLENETALYHEEGGGRNSYWDARVTLSDDKLRAGFGLLPRDIEIWWYPGFVTGRNREVRHAQSARLARLLEASCRVRFIDYSLAKPPGQNNWWDMELTALRDQIASRPPIPIVYFYARGRYWDVSQTRDMLDSVDGREVIIYPGQRNWLLSAEEVGGRVLAARAEVPR